MSRIVVVDDHAIVRDGLRAVLTAHGHEVVGEADDAALAIEVIVRSQPDVVLLDLGLVGRSGLDVLARMQQRQVRARAVILTMSSQPRHVAEAWRMGAAGYVLKGSHSCTVLDAITAASAGTRYLDPALAEMGEDLLLGGEAEDGLATLSLREREVLLLVVNGHSSGEIGDRLHLSPKTVDTYRSRLMRKVGVADVAGLVKVAVREGLIDVRR